jgi:hypothetical protein
MTTPTYEELGAPAQEVRRQNWMAAVRKGETTAGLAEWKNRPRATIEAWAKGGYDVLWDDKFSTHRDTWWGALRAARKLERQHRRAREWNEANG